MFALIIVILFIIALLIQSFLHRLERKDLYNRIMARDLTEYQKIDKKSSNSNDSVITKNPLRKQIMKNEQEHNAKFMRGEID